MIKKLLILVLFISCSITLGAAPPAVKKVRQQIAEREMAKAYYTKKFEEMRNQENIFKKSLKPTKDKYQGFSVFSKKF